MQKKAWIQGPGWTYLHVLISEKEVSVPSSMTVVRNAHNNQWGEFFVNGKVQCTCEQGWVPGLDWYSQQYLPCPGLVGVSRLRLMRARVGPGLGHDQL